MSKVTLSEIERRLAVCVQAVKDLSDKITATDHTVVHGDTLWQIAERFLGKGSRYTEIVKLYGLKSNVLYTGQVLELPEK